jgi:hypothetical protein
MLRQRHEKGLIGKEPCTTGCPVVRPQDSIRLVPFLKESYGAFDPATKPNPALRTLIRQGKVAEFSRAKLLGASRKLGDPIYILNPSAPSPNSAS